MSESIKCPLCNQPLTMFGKLWICPTHGQLPEAKPFTPMRIFLSYGHDSNEELVRRIKADLEKRGHNVWFDKSEIKGGLNWRRSITDGIVDSNRVLSFLSKHSTRDPGVCLDEIAIAIGVKGGNIQTILVESEKEVKPPPSISHIQWLDMHDWKEKYAAGGAEWETWYQEKLTEIVAVVESDESRRFAGEIKTLEEHLKPISSDSRIFQLLRKGLVGRTWLVEAIEKWRNAADRASRLFWIMGSPGVGKSAFAAHLAHYGKDKILAVQFCEYDKPDHRSAHRIVRTLAFQIATRLPDYRKLLLTLPEIKDLDRKNPSELFDYLLTNPLRNAIDGGRDRYLVVIDALDEAGGNGRNELVEMLAQNAARLPEWIGIVVTSRPEKAVTAPLQGLNPFILDTAIESNRADIRDYLRCELASHLQNRQDADRLVEQILEKSEGVFLYVERFCNDIQRGHLLLDNPGQFPQGLGGIFFQYFQRQFPDLEKFRKDVRPALRAILAAREPLPMEILQRLFNWQDEELRDFTRPLASLFPITTEAGHEVIKPYHKSLRDWLADKAKAEVFFVSTLEGHRLLAEACWKEYARGANTMTEYSIRHVRAHLAHIGDTERKDKIESDPVYIALLPKKSLRDRVLRVWISSTFRDMNRERDYLVKYVFPQLRELCELSNDTLVEVDLRWGITEEESAQGKVLPIILEEIKRCKPYFIGLLGERYGWVPENIPQELIEDQSWLKEHLGKTGKSVTELEILHGVLNNPEKTENAFFYFRAPAYIKSIPPEKQKDFTAEDATGAEKLLRLKQRIRVAASEGRCSLRENFRTPKELGEWVLQDLREKIDPQQALHIEVESARHLAFARRQVRTYLSRQGHFEQLDAALLSQRKPLLVTGEVGIGKSALLANWSLQRQESYPIEIILLHFAGSVPDSTNDSRAMRRIMHELRRLCYLSMDVPEADDEIRRHFPNFLNAASEMERIILVVDGLEAFGSSDEPCSLDWLPDNLSNNCKVIASSSSSAIAGALRNRGWSEFRLSSLTFSEREKLIAHFLSAYSRRLNSKQVAEIAASPQTGNPLYLISLLDELRQAVGHSDLLDRAIRYYLTANCVSELFERILERFENDFGSDLVKHSLSFMWKSPQGLTDEEILGLLRKAGTPVSSTAWKSFEIAARSILLETGGRFRICHPAWNTAVRNRYFP